MNLIQFNDLQPSGIADAVLQIRGLMRSLISKSVEFVLDNNCAAENIYRIFTGHRTHRVVATRKIPYQHEQQKAEYYEILAIDKYDIGHVLSIRFLCDPDDLETMCSMVSDLTWRYCDDGDICYSYPRDYMVVGLSRLDIVNGGHGVYTVGCLGFSNDLPYDVPFPTMLVNGEIAEDNDVSRLARELMHIDYPASCFGDISQEINTVCDVMLQAVDGSEQMAANALIAVGVHENNDIPIDDILQYMEIPAVFRARLLRDIDKLIALDLYKKRRTNKNEE